MEAAQFEEALKSIAQICEGYSTITDSSGIRIRTYDSSGTELTEMRGMVYDLAREAGESGQIKIGFSQIANDAQTWAIPFGNYVIAASNIAKTERDQALVKSLDQALPFIARLVGGEAVIFDKNGLRLNTVDAGGKVIEKQIGKVSKLARKAMEDQTPTFGESTSVHGAMAIRIPITKEYGLGFNNELTVHHEKKLFEEVKKFQTARYNLKDIIGESEKITYAKHLCLTASRASSILLNGETGTGKELFAQAIHNESDRRDKPFVAINCGAIPATIIESYLFGYSGGAFTGAKKEGSSGAFEQANTGTIFLDEISEMPPDLQTKLLRVIQEKEVMRIGEFTPIKLDVRIISSTHSDLLQAVREGRFREDLYYRINVIEIRIPPLRERKEDIPLLVKNFIAEFNRLLGKFVFSAEDRFYDILMSHHWPGNVRELKSCVERAMNMTSVNESQLLSSSLPPYLLNLSLGHSGPSGKSFNLKDQIQHAEIAAIKNALHHAGGVKKEAADLLGISTITLWRKIKEFAIEE